MGAGLLICLIIFTLDVAIGSSHITLEAVFQALFFPSIADNLTKVIIWEHKLPMAAAGVLVGAAFGIFGTVMQTILDNPLASPYTFSHFCPYSQRLLSKCPDSR